MMKIKFTADSVSKMGKVIAAIIKEQIAAGITATGERLPGGVDLKDTGALIASIEEKISSEGLEIACSVPYAVFVENRYHFFGVSPQFLPTLFQRLQPIAEAGAYFDEVA
jgi:hypothetical protein